MEVKKMNEAEYTALIAKMVDQYNSELLPGESEITYREMELVEKAAEQRKATSTPKVTKTATSKLQISDNWLKYGNSYYRRPVGNIEVFFS